MVNKLNLDNIQVPGLKSMTDEMAQVVSGGALTLYEHFNFNRDRAGRTTTISGERAGNPGDPFGDTEPDFSIVNLTGSRNFNDLASSVRIDPGEVWVLYTDVNGGGREIVIDGTNDSEGFDAVTSAQLFGNNNDVISSVRRIQ